MRECAHPPVAAVPDEATLTDAVWDNADRTGEAVQFLRRTGGGWHPVTCAQFRTEVTLLARALAAAGVQPGDRVVLLSRTRYEWTLLDYALLANGAVVVPLDDTASHAQVAQILSDAGATACVVDTAAHATMVRQVAAELPGMFQVWCIDEGDLARLDPSSVAPAQIDARRHAVRADDPATLVYTCGTTGAPQGCVLTHRHPFGRCGQYRGEPARPVHLRRRRHLAVAAAGARVCPTGAVRVCPGRDDVGPPN